MLPGSHYSLLLVSGLLLRATMHVTIHLVSTYILTMCMKGLRDKTSMSLSNVVALPLD